MSMGILLLVAIAGVVVLGGLALLAVLLLTGKEADRDHQGRD